MGDEEAGRHIAVLAETRRKETGESLRDATRAILSVRDPAPTYTRPETDPIKVHEAGVEIEKWVVKLMNDLPIDRRTAIRLACGLCPDHYGPAYTGFPVKRLSLDEIYRVYADGSK